jgi:membrane protease YdiL (CAAX protease family)
MDGVLPARTTARVGLAPWWHTALLVLLVLTVATVGTALVHGGWTAPLAAEQGADRYVPLLLMQWSLFIYVCRVGRARSVLLELLGVAWAGIDRALADAALAIAGWILVEISYAWAVHLGMPRATPSILPRTGADRIAWVVVAASIGFCEEVVYRGYLQTQLTALAGPTLGIALQALLFGVAHADQGQATAVRIALDGAAFGVVAGWRRSLVPGIVCHIGIDLAAGFL